MLDQELLTPLKVARRLPDFSAILPLFRWQTVDPLLARGSQALHAMLPVVGAISDTLPGAAVDLQLALADRAGSRQQTHRELIERWN